MGSINNMSAINNTDTNTGFKEVMSNQQNIMSKLSRDTKENIVAANIDPLFMTEKKNKQDSLKKVNASSKSSLSEQSYKSKPNINDDLRQKSLEKFEPTSTNRATHDSAVEQSSDKKKEAINNFPHHHSKQIYKKLKVFIISFLVTASLYIIVQLISIFISK